MRSLVALLVLAIGAAASAARTDEQINRRAARGERAMAVSEHRLATEAGIEVLRAGGNAIDGACATAFALAVVYPVAGNIGGGGFLLYRSPEGEVHSIDFDRVSDTGSSDLVTCYHRPIPPALTFR